MWPPFPERERSKEAGTPIARQVSRYAPASSCHDCLSKSTARNQQVSSESSGYTPIVSFPSRWLSTTVSVKGRRVRVCKATFLRSSSRLELIAFQSFRAAGAYPERPSAFSQRLE